MIEKSHPEPEERNRAHPVNPVNPVKNKVFPCNHTLRDRLRAMRDAPGSIWSNSQFGQKLGYSSAVFSQYLSDDGNKYPSNIAGLEKKIEDFLQAMERKRASGIETSPSKVADEMLIAFENTRNTNSLGVIIAESGEGKTRGIELILKDHPLAILIEVAEWNCSKGGTMSAIWNACPHDGWDRTGPQFPWLVQKMRGSDRPFIFDDAHKLSRDALGLIASFQEKTKCPVALIGINLLVQKLVGDLTSQTTSRVGIHWPIKASPKSDSKLLASMILSIAKDINGELDDVVDLARQVADHHGHFRAVEQRLKLAARFRRADDKLTWPAAFRQAHTLSLHPCQLT